jgi:hypothetical protein
VIRAAFSDDSAAAFFAFVALDLLSTVDVLTFVAAFFFDKVSVPTVMTKQVHCLPLVFGPLAFVADCPPATAGGSDKAMRSLQSAFTTPPHHVPASALHFGQASANAGC